MFGRRRLELLLFWGGLLTLLLLLLLPGGVGQALAVWCLVVDSHRSEDEGGKGGLVEVSGGLLVGVGC